MGYLYRDIYQSDVQEGVEYPKTEAEFMFTLGCFLAL